MENVLYRGKLTSLYRIVYTNNYVSFDRDSARCLTIGLSVYLCVCLTIAVFLIVYS